MKDLKLIPNTTPDADHPNGQINNDTGASNGTPVGREVNNDMVQFFQRLLIQAGMTANDLYDNVSNGFQTIEALEAKVKAVLSTPLSAVGYNYIGQTELPFTTDWSQPTPTKALFTKEHGGVIRVSAEVIYGGSGINISGAPLAVTPPTTTSKICDIVSTDLQMKYPPGLTCKYFKCFNNFQNTEVVVAVNSANEVFIASGLIGTADTIRLEFTFM